MRSLLWVKKPISKGHMFSAFILTMTPKKEQKKDCQSCLSNHWNINEHNYLFMWKDSVNIYITWKIVINSYTASIKYTLLIGKYVLKQANFWEDNTNSYHSMVHSKQPLYFISFDSKIFMRLVLFSLFYKCVNWDLTK